MHTVFIKAIEKRFLLKDSDHSGAENDKLPIVSCELIKNFKL